MLGRARGGRRAAAAGRVVAAARPSAAGRGGGDAPRGVRGTFRDLPRLLADSFHLVWSAGRSEFLVSRRASSSSPRSAWPRSSSWQRCRRPSGGGRAAGFRRSSPTSPRSCNDGALDFAAAVEASTAGSCAALVGRRAFERVLDVATESTCSRSSRRTSTTACGGRRRRAPSARWRPSTASWGSRRACRRGDRGRARSLQPSSSRSCGRLHPALARGSEQP